MKWKRKQSVTRNMDTIQFCIKMIDQENRQKYQKKSICQQYSVKYTKTWYLIVYNTFGSTNKSCITIYQTRWHCIKKYKIQFQSQIITTQHNVLVFSIKTNRNCNKPKSFDTILFELMLSIKRSRILRVILDKDT